MSRGSQSSAAHRNKRQYQPSITSFFAREESPDSSSDDGPITRAWHQHHAKRPQQQRDSLVPAVPGPVQADLLSVGMRVRKSVPEGYKTHKTPALPSIQTTLSHNKSPPVSAAAVTTTTTAPVPDATQHQRELLPFCGLHKIGGYAEQPVTNVHLYGGNADANGDNRPVNIFPLPAQAFNQPFSSQSSADSSVSNSSLRPNPTNPNKRGWSEEEGGALNLTNNFHFKIPMKVSEDEVPVSPLSESPPQGFNAFPQAALRPFAQPKTRRAGAGRMFDVDGAMLKEGDMDVDVENTDHAEARVLVGSSSDFGEAEFLRPWSPGREVEMGGL